jgi:RHS repeat-associated protein
LAGAVAALIAVPVIVAVARVSNPVKVVGAESRQSSAAWQGGVQAVRLRRAAEVQLARRRWLGSPKMRAQRVASRMSFHNLSSGGAQAVLVRDFGSAMAGMSANPAAAVAAMGPVVRYIGDNRAVVRTGRSLKLAVSSVPLRVASGSRQMQPVSLRLRRTGDVFSAVNPLQSVSVARRLSGGVAVGSSGIRLVPQGSDVAGTLVYGRSVFFANVGLDEDASVAPTISGVELSAVLRSRLSPQQLRYRVVLPAGMTMRALNGGAVISGAGVSAHVLAPTAVDAQGQNVPVRMTVSGDQLVLYVAHRELDVAYPLLVDPTVTYEPPPTEWFFKYGNGDFYYAPWKRIGYDEVEAPACLYPACESPDRYWAGGEGERGAFGMFRWGFEPEAEFHPIRWVFSSLVLSAGEFTGVIANGCNEWTSASGSPSEVVFPSRRYALKACVSGSSGTYFEAGLENRSVKVLEPSVSASFTFGSVLAIEQNVKGFQPELNELFSLENPGEPKLKRACSGDPVNCATGNLAESQTDLSLSGRGLPLTLTRTYNDQGAVTQPTPGMFGYGWSSSYSDHVAADAEAGTATVFQANGSAVTFTGTPGEEGELVAPGWSQAKLVRNSDGTYTYTAVNQDTFHFSEGGLLLSEADRSGNVTTMNRNSEGRLESVTDPAGGKLTFSYNSGGQVESVKDPMGHTVKYTYESGNLVSVTEPGETAARWQFKYDSSHRLTTMTDGRGGTTTNEYDSSNRVISQTDPMKRTDSFAYEGADTTITNKATGSVTKEVFTGGDEPESITRGYGTSRATTETFTYDEAGDLTSVTDGNGHTTKYEYDGERNMIKMISPEEYENETKWTYNKTHDVLTVETPDFGETTYVRNSAGEPESMSRPAGGETRQTTKYTYNSYGELTSMTGPLERTWKYEYDSQGDRTSETDPEGNKRTWEYDEDSREIAMVSPRGNAKGEPSKYTTKIERDSRGRPITVTDPLGHKTQYTYDGDGNLETVTDPNGNKTKYIYDADNEQTKVEEPNGTITETGYDGAGQVTSQTNGNKHTIKYVRNILEEITEVIDPRERKTTKEYDKVGNLISSTDAAKRTTTYKYDADNQIREISYSDGKTPTAKYGYNGDGKLLYMEDGSGRTFYTWDDLDQLEKSENGHGEVIKYEYDLANEPIKITYPNGKSVTRAYDKDGRLSKVTDWLEHSTKFAYNADSELSEIKFPSGTSNEDKDVYNEADQMTEVKMNKGTETLASLVYTRDNDGQVKSTTTKGLPGEESTSYTYNVRSELNKMGTVAYEYDGDDNPIKIGSSSYTYGKADELETGTGLKYTYNEIGERTKMTPSGAATTYGYDQAGNLISVERPEEGKIPAISDTYTYDGNSLRASQTISGKTTYMAWDVVEEPAVPLSDGTNSYIYGPGGLPIEQINNSTGTVSYLHHDQAGSTRLLTGSTGTVEGKCSYSAYGTPTCEGTTTTPLGYDAQYTSSDTGLIYMRARVYDPATAQFLSVDPVNQFTRAPYNYAHDNPLNFTDAAGLEAIPLPAPVAGGCAAAPEICGAAALGGVDAWLGVKVFNAWAGSEEAGNDEGEAFLKQKEAEREKCGDPTQPPGEGWEWKGNGPEGSSEGSWVNPETGEKLYPDLNHPEPLGPHYDYTAPDGSQYRIYPDGRIEPKAP